VSKVVGTASELIYNKADDHNADDVEEKDTYAANKADHYSLTDIVYLKEDQSATKAIISMIPEHS
jgi:hypothetical protein